MRWDEIVVDDEGDDDAGLRPTEEITSHSGGEREGS